MRESEVKSRAIIQSAFGPCAAAVAHHNAANDGQADPGAVELFCRMKSLKDAEELVRVLGIETDTVITHVEDRLAVSTLSPDLNARLFPTPRVFEGVSDKICQHQTKHFRVAVNG